ncbi:Mob protein [Paracoccus sp. NSM]|uniref:Mob protein n=1 Tax=Paracoccus sp. NSM TaxID=3457784 RepID=UPI004035DF79
MAYQFIHVETYAEAATPVPGSKTHFNSAAQVMGEARRDPIHSQHVPDPQCPEPVALEGVMELDAFIALRAEKLAAITETVSAKNGTTYTRRLRKDAATLYTEIHSHPMTVAEFEADRDSTRPAIRAWQARVIDDFRARMPPGVDFTAIMHLDEKHVHMHVLAINSGDPKLDANKLHAGKAAAARYREGHDSDAIASLPKPELLPRPKKPKKSKPSKNRTTQKKNNEKDAAVLSRWEDECRSVEMANDARQAEWEAKNKLHLKEARRLRGKPKVKDAYSEGLRSLQDAYYEAVGKPCGLLRVGPRLERKSTKEYAEAKRQAKRLAQDLAQIAQDRKANDAEKQRLTHNANLIADVGDEIKRDRSLQAAKAQRLSDLERRLAQQGRVLSEREATVKAREAAAATRDEEFRRDYARAKESVSSQRSALDAREKQIEQAQAALIEQQDALGALVEAMDATITALENDELIAAPEETGVRGLPDAVRRFFSRKATEGTARMRHLLDRFLNVMLKAGGRQAAKPDDNEYLGPR